MWNYDLETIGYITAHHYFFIPIYLVYNISLFKIIEGIEIIGTYLNQYMKFNFLVMGKSKKLLKQSSNMTHRKPVKCLEKMITWIKVFIYLLI